LSGHDDGGPAFPGQEINQQYANEPCSHGMSLRDWFAGQALSAFLSNAQFEAYRQTLDGTIPDDVQDLAVAQTAYHYADAMLAARK